MVINAHGQTTSLADLRQRFPQSLKGSNLKQLMACSAVLGFSARPLRLELQELGQLVRPCILHWDLNHFVVLHKVGRKHVVVLDPAVGERRLSIDEVSRHFTGVALELTPQAHFVPQVQAPQLKLSQLTGKAWDGRLCKSWPWRWCWSCLPSWHRCSTKWWWTMC
jgi:ATP-binding cassette subfamily B protein RaxB